VRSARLWRSLVASTVLAYGLGPVCAGAADPSASAPLDASARARLDATALAWLTRTAAPSVSIAIVRDGKLLYTRAYGAARLEPRTPATEDTRYAVDSITKEFTAATLLLLVEQKKLSLEDRVGRWFPQLGAASRVTVRQLLTHTSGLRDYWPQDFVPPEMLEPTSTEAILKEWVARPLDFAPGSDWQYSNTGYVLAGAIAEKAAGEPLFELMRARIFVPLGMTGVSEADREPLHAPDALGYTRYGLGPAHPAPKEGAGWLFGAASLAMSARDLATWDISLIRHTLLSRDSYQEELRPVRLRDGRTRDYALGLDVEHVEGRLRIGHDGAGSGYLAVHRIWPEQQVAVIVLTNSDWTDPEELLARIAWQTLAPLPEEARARRVFEKLQQGRIEPADFTASGRSYFTAPVLAELRASLAPLGPVQLLHLERTSHRGGMITRRWRILCGAQHLEAIERGYPDGRLEQFMVQPVD
jgi:D-alanyl-D-alanine carboxypeptidase